MVDQNNFKYFLQPTKANILKKALVSMIARNGLSDSGTLSHAHSDTSLYRLNKKDLAGQRNFGNSLTVPKVSLGIYNFD